MVGGWDRGQKQEEDTEHTGAEAGRGCFSLQFRRVQKAEPDTDQALPDPPPSFTFSPITTLFICFITIICGKMGLGLFSEHNSNYFYGREMFPPSVFNN